MINSFRSSAPLTSYFCGRLRYALSLILCQWQLCNYSSSIDPCKHLSFLAIISQFIFEINPISILKSLYSSPFYISSALELITDKSVGVASSFQFTLTISPFASVMPL